MEQDEKLQRGPLEYSMLSLLYTILDTLNFVSEYGGLVAAEMFYNDFKNKQKNETHIGPNNYNFYRKKEKNILQEFKFCKQICLLINSTISAMEIL